MLSALRFLSKEMFVQELVLLQGVFLALVSSGGAVLKFALMLTIEDVYMMVGAFVACITKAKDETQEVLVLEHFRFFPFTVCVHSACPQLHEFSEHVLDAIVLCRIELVCASGCHIKCKSSAQHCLEHGVVEIPLATLNFLRSSNHQ